ncbi:hypothetical protein, conserved [Eimeria tenella]|uniref:RAP domain-containing protein n=1 Tax=Eimeria tenella TaxID=5802 RepID=U6KVW6_EIMTE|nr:hypothetical protein, conserved [Eimeria tenella]CDJ39650.1 hypothetical protein, conserved [Eimeria tenella]|eukprot:XP_013230405.1 hypothetical protein, conserved [Eimeria tenella]
MLIKSSAETTLAGRADKEWIFAASRGVDNWCEDPFWISRPNANMQRHSRWLGLTECCCRAAADLLLLRIPHRALELQSAEFKCISTSPVSRVAYPLAAPARQQQQPRSRSRLGQRCSSKRARAAAACGHHLNKELPTLPLTRSVRALALQPNNCMQSASLICKCAQSRAALSTAAAGTAAAAAEAAADGSYPVTDGSPGSGLFVEYSVESVREALKRRRARKAVESSEKFEENSAARPARPAAASAADSAAAARRRKKRQKRPIFKAISDSDLVQIEPSELSSQQLLYLLGRACFLESSASSERCGTAESAAGPAVAPAQWQAIFRSIRRRISEMDVLEITRACQGLAYAKKLLDRAATAARSQTPDAADAATAAAAAAAARRTQWQPALDECCAAFEEVQRQVAKQVHQLQGDCLSRVFYASLKGGFRENGGFVEFVCDEVLSRLDKLRPWHVCRIFQASFSSNVVADGFAVKLGEHLVKNLAFLPAKSISVLIPALVQLRMLENPAQAAKLNVIAGKRFRGLGDPTLLVLWGKPMLFYKILTPVNIVALIKGLIRAEAPTNYAVTKVPDSEESVSGFSEAAEWNAAPTEATADALTVHGANKILLPLKLMELCIRHDYPEVYAALAPSMRSWLGKVRATQVKLACFAPPLEQQHVNAPLVRIAGGEFHLHPSMYGPFLLELSDPLSRTTVEWDTPWLLCPPWNEFEQKAYAEKRRRILQAEGWEVILVPLAPYTEAEDAAAKERYLRGAARKLIPGSLRRNYAETGETVSTF